jgi:hypothetical protein
MTETMLEQAKNRPNKKIYYILGTTKPQEFLHPDVAHPDQVKQLYIDLSDANILDDETGPEYTKITGPWTKRDTTINFDVRVEMDHKWIEDFLNTRSFNSIEGPRKLKKSDHSTKTLCKDIVNFKNLELLNIKNFKLTTDLWIEFAKNSTCLKNIHFAHDLELEPAALEAIFNIPTLKKVTLHNIVIPWFPPGPNNIEYLSIYRPTDDEYTDNFMESFTTNLRTYTNLKIIYLTWFINTNKPFIDLGLTCTDLEHVSISNPAWNFGYKREKTAMDYNIIDTLLTIPTLKKLYINREYILYKNRY